MIILQIILFLTILVTGIRNGAVFSKNKKSAVYAFPRYADQNDSKFGIRKVKGPSTVSVIPNYTDQNLSLNFPTNPVQPLSSPIPKDTSLTFDFNKAPDTPKDNNNWQLAIVNDAGSFPLEKQVDQLAIPPNSSVKSEEILPQNSGVIDNTEKSESVIPYGPNNLKFEEQIPKEENKIDLPGAAPNRKSENSKEEKKKINRPKEEPSNYLKVAKSFIILSDEDLVSLRSGRWLTNFIIDYLVLNIIGAREFESQNGKFAYMLSEIGTRFIVEGQNFTEKCILNTIEIKNKILLIPLNYKNIHWSLLVADTTQKTLVYYDPSNTPQLNLQRAKSNMKRFLRMLSRRNRYVKKHEKVDTNIKNWKTKIPEFEMPIQKDSYNCGVYILMYMDCLINNIKKPLVGPNTYREILREVFWTS